MGIVVVLGSGRMAPGAQPPAARLGRRSGSLADMQSGSTIRHEQ
jgi:hypothetical protein